LQFCARRHVAAHGGVGAIGASITSTIVADSEKQPGTEDCREATAGPFRR